jgi:hypothetical protein
MSRPHRSPFHHRSRAARRARARRKRGQRITAIAVGVVLVCIGAVAAVAVLSGGGTQTADASSRPAVRVAGAHTSAQAGAPSAQAGAPGTRCRSPLTPDAPLRLWIAGDSIAWSIGQSLGKRAAATGVVAPVYESRVSSGLSSPGFFDWPQRISEEIPRLNPEVIVFVMGTNDWLTAQPTPLDASGQPAWTATYAAQVQAMVDAMARDGRTLYWIGAPILRDSHEDPGAKAVDDVIENVVDHHADAHYVDARALLDAPDGTYTSTLEIDGHNVTVRTGDGVHPTADGADIVSDSVFTALDRQCDVRDQAQPKSPQTLVETKGSTSVGQAASGGATSGSATPATSAPTSPPTITTTPATTPATTAPAAPSPTTTPAPVTTPPTTVASK